MKIRQAKINDIPALLQLRMALFSDVGELSEPQVEQALRQATTTYLRTGLADGSVCCWVAEWGGDVVACATLSLFIRAPYPGNLTGKEAYLFNMYTLPAYRKQGIASALLDAIVAHAQSEQLGKMWLHASDEGRPLYERAGFVANPAYMEWRKISCSIEPRYLLISRLILMQTTNCSNC